MQDKPASQRNLTSFDIDIVVDNEKNLGLADPLDKSYVKPNEKKEDVYLCIDRSSGKAKYYVKNPFSSLSEAEKSNPNLSVYSLSRQKFKSLKLQARDDEYSTLAKSMTASFYNIPFEGNEVISELSPVSKKDPKALKLKEGGIYLFWYPGENVGYFRSRKIEPTEFEKDDAGLHIYKVDKKKLKVNGNVTQEAAKKYAEIFKQNIIPYLKQRIPRSKKEEDDLQAADSMPPPQIANPLLDEYLANFESYFLATQSDTVWQIVSQSIGKYVPDPTKGLADIVANPASPINIASQIGFPLGIAIASGIIRYVFMSIQYDKAYKGNVPEAEKQKLIKDCVAYSAKSAITMLGWEAGLFVGQVVLTALTGVASFHPGYLIAAAAVSVASGIGQGIFAVAAQALHEKHLYGKVKSTPYELGKLFLTNFVSGTLWTAASLIPVVGLAKPLFTFVIRPLATAVATLATNFIVPKVCDLVNNLVTKLSNSHFEFFKHGKSEKSKEAKTQEEKEKLVDEESEKPKPPESSL